MPAHPPAVSLTATPYALLWDRLPARANRFATAWWYVLLFPKQSTGYGPAQMMFALASRTGDLVVNGTHMTGAFADGPAFPALAMGWLHDGTRAYPQTLHHPATARLTPGLLEAWDAAGYGGRLQASDARPFGVEALFRGPAVAAQFLVAGDPAVELARPAITAEVASPVGNAQYVVLDDGQFEGRFRFPDGTERWLEGAACLHRILVNTPFCPWKWVYLRFADGSLFSCMVPFLGPQVLRRGASFFPDWLERLHVDFMPFAQFTPGDTRQTVRFPKISVVPMSNRHGLPVFHVRATHPEGHHLTLHVYPYDHVGYTLETPLLRWTSRFHYNVYMVEAGQVAGQIAGRTLAPATLGHGYGGAEYTWGLAW